jgi:hypothetical protein
MIFAQADLTAATNNSVFTSGDANGDLVTVMLTNRSGAAINVTLYWVPNGVGAPAVKHAFEYALSLDANCAYERAGISMGNGDAIYANPSAPGVSITVQGLPI